MLTFPQLSLQLGLANGNVASSKSIGVDKSIKIAANMDGEDMVSPFVGWEIETNYFET